MPTHQQGSYLDIQTERLRSALGLRSKEENTSKIQQNTDANLYKIFGYDTIERDKIDSLRKRR